MLPAGHKPTKLRQRTKADKLITMDEIKTVIADLSRRAKRTALARRQLILFRLAVCCGLRVSEICDLRVSDVDIERLDLTVRNGKGGKARTVPLEYDADNLRDLADWKAQRLTEGGEYFLQTRNGGPINRIDARKSFMRACKILNRPADRPVTIHDGRHSFLSHALDQGRSLVEVQEAAGHENVATTSRYLHLVKRDRTIGKMFS